MVKVTQTEDSIKIVIEINRLLKRKPDIVIFPDYVKFNNPPIFFERYLSQEIDEIRSHCRMYKSEAQLILLKKNKGIWDEIFKNFTKEELLEKRKCLADRIISRSQETDKLHMETFEKKKRAEIENEIARQAAERAKIKSMEEAFITQAFKPEVEEPKREEKTRRSEPQPPPEPKIIHVEQRQVRSAGKINITFSSFSRPTPKRESQENTFS